MKRCLLDSSFIIDLLNELADDEPGPALRWLARHLNLVRRDIDRYDRPTRPHLLSHPAGDIAAAAVGGVEGRDGVGVGQRRAAHGAGRERAGGGERAGPRDGTRRREREVADRLRARTRVGYTSD